MESVHVGIMCIIVLTAHISAVFVQIKYMIHVEF